ncbi:MAG: alpha-E domain-containing protein [Polyangiaceae bacterium]|nr:alpha-E domain-containing protein [Polyangiaceae bacterium]MCB9608707.1 alpha-E domain-containing protein [Polyangiaceae bacterium]
MISRVAETCFWLGRQVERSENLARLLSVNQSFVLDVELDPPQRWQPVMVVSGELPRFKERFPEEAILDGEVVQRYLTWDQDNPVSLVSAAYWARENARTIREVISLELWEALNEFWRWLMDGPGKRLYRSDREAFYSRFKEMAALTHGVASATMLHEEPLTFMQLGWHLERAQQTARIVDIKYHTLGPTSSRETPLEAAQWLALLRSCSATEPYYKCHKNPPNGLAIVDFLLRYPTFPRSILYSLKASQVDLQRIRAATTERGEECEVRVQRLLDYLEAGKSADLSGGGVHAALTRVVDETSEICNLLHSIYFDPSMPEAPAAE